VAKSVPTSPRGRANLTIVVVAAIAVLAVFLPSSFQDFVPGYVAATLARRGDFASIYLPPAARGLFDSAPSFLDLSVRSVAQESFRETNATAFVSPPPAILIYSLLSRLPFVWAARAWALVQAVLMAACFVLLEKHVLRRLAYSTTVSRWCTIAFAPVLFMAVSTGQSSCLFLAVVCACLADPNGRQHDALLGVSLGLLVILKLWPALGLLALPFMRRRRAALIAFAIVAASVVASLALFPSAVFVAFARGLQPFSGRVIPYYNNISFDNLFTHAWLGDVSENLISVPHHAMVTSGLLKAGLATAFAAAFAFRRPGKGLAWAALWSMLLVVCPLVWDHYLVMIPGLVGLVLRSTDSRRLRASAMACLPLAGTAILVAHAVPSGRAFVCGPFALFCMLALVLAACWLSPRRFGAAAYAQPPPCAPAEP
jgi:hypothetical protein